MARRLCCFHKTGVPYPDVRAEDFFQAGCPRCEEKRVAGIVTGNEPRPMNPSFEQAVLSGLRTPRSDWRE